MIDAHAHLHDRKYDDDREEMIQRSFEGGITAIVTIGTSVGESRDAVALAESHDGIYATIGLHPQLFNDSRDAVEDGALEQFLGITGAHDEQGRMDRLRNAVGELERLATSEKVRAIGEIGLEYFAHGRDPITPPQKRWQRTGFIVQVALAKKLGLPVVVHCRPEDVAASDAYHDCVDIIADFPEVKFVMHCHMGNVAVTERLLDCENVDFSFTGNVTFSKKDDDQMSQVVSMIPLERMMIETDAPYLTPVPYRGKRNEPLYVEHVAQRIARLKDISVEDVVSQTEKNAERFFDISV